MKPRLKNIYLSVSRDLEVVVKSPKISSSTLFSILEKRESWIRKKLFVLQSNQLKSFQIGKEVVLFDEVLSIDSQEVNHLRLLLDRSKNKTEQNMLKKYDLFYKSYAEEYIINRVECFARVMNLDYESINFRKMKRRWGSCSSQKVLTFNTQLMKVKKELIDYVVVHELAHLVHMNHSKKFHDLIEEYLPLSKAYQKELKTISLQVL